VKHTNHTVLLVEDDPDDVAMIMDALDGSTYSLNIVHKKNGLQAVNYLNELTIKNSALPCIIIMDMNMPVISGKQLLSIIKSEDRFRSIPVIVFTTSSNDGDKKFCNDLNVRMVTKPNGMTAFNKEVQAFIKECTII